MFAIPKLTADIAVSCLKTGDMVPLLCLARILTQQIQNPNSAEEVKLLRQGLAILHAAFSHVIKLLSVLDDNSGAYAELIQHLQAYAEKTKREDKPNIKLPDFTQRNAAPPEGHYYNQLALLLGELTIEAQDTMTSCLKM